ncbi:MAG: hypothetical protein JOS17DRAFT_105539 [Linnemannia elongata]|nr:MAG: hypothetical protein JOS17DRAFT_105539 [Linnemannia elongata]
MYVGMGCTASVTECVRGIWLCTCPKWLGERVKGTACGRKGRKSCSQWFYFCLLVHWVRCPPTPQTKASLVAPPSLSKNKQRERERERENERAGDGRWKGWSEEGKREERAAKRQREWKKSFRHGWVHSFCSTKLTRRRLDGVVVLLTFVVVGCTFVSFVCAWWSTL